MKKIDEKDKEFWRGIYTLATVGINMVAATFIGLGWAGCWTTSSSRGSSTGNHSRYSPLLFLVFGIIAGFRNIFLIVREKGDTGKNKDDRRDGS